MVSGFITMRMVMASTSILSQVTSLNSAAISVAISSHITMAWRCALDLVTTVSSLRGRDCASLKAKRMMRSTPARVRIDTSVATSSGKPLVDAAADAGIFAFRVFADDHPVEFLAVNVAQRAGDAGQDARRADIGVLIERLADREPQAPQRDVVGHVGRAGRAEQDGVVIPDLVAAVLRHHDAVLLVVFGPPVEMVDLEFEIAVALRQGVQHLDACGNDFGADAVARDGCYGVRLHG